jgi:hypothetical protein
VLFQAFDYRRRAFDVAVDARSIYWSQPDANTVSRLSKANVTVTVPYGGLQYPQYIAVGDDGLYVQDQVGVTRIPLDFSTPPLVLYRFPPCPPGVLCVQARALRIHGESVYLGTSLGITRIPRAGGPAASLGNWTDLWDFAVSDTSVYAASGLVVELSTMPIGGGPTRILRPGLDKAPSVLALDPSGSAVYWDSVGITRTLL